MPSTSVFRTVAASVSASIKSHRNRLIRTQAIDNASLRYDRVATRPTSKSGAGIRSGGKVDDSRSGEIRRATARAVNSRRYARYSSEPCPREANA